MGDQINDVDEIFESFVKKKLKQLGIKRLATKSSDEITTKSFAGTEPEIREEIKPNNEKDSNRVETGQENLNTDNDRKRKAKKDKKSKKAKKEKNRHRKSKEKKSSKRNSSPIQMKLDITDCQFLTSNSSDIISRKEFRHGHDHSSSLVKPYTKDDDDKRQNFNKCRSRHGNYISKNSDERISHRKIKSQHKHSAHRRTRSRSPIRRSCSHERESHRKHSTSRKGSRNSESFRISKEDKVRLLEIAKANALAQHKVSSVANSMSVTTTNFSKNSSLSVKELTEMCKDISSTPEVAKTFENHVNKSPKESSEPLQVNHPFKVQEMTISMNIPTRTKVPILENKPLEVLSKEFPVSCGQQHRRKEVLESVYGKWQAVAKDEVAQDTVEELVKSDKVYVVHDNLDVDLSSVIAERISATRELQNNPGSNAAQKKLRTVQQKLDNWTKSKQVPGQFTGQVGLQPMPRHELEGGRQAWFKPGDLENAKRVGGIGKSLLQKMGWKPGTPLGKTMPGQLEPLSLNVKNDRRGLSCFTEEFGSKSKKHKGQLEYNSMANNVKDLSHKHPVSALMEICSKRHWPPPQFSLVDPVDTKTFTFKVTVRNDEYKGHCASNKKQAKLFAASVALQCMGLLPQASKSV